MMQQRKQLLATYDVNYDNALGTGLGPTHQHRIYLC